MQDPRVFFAAERTLLAWVRTGLTVIALGFVVARFGLFLNLLAVSGGVREAPTGASDTLGIILVLAGSTIILGALHNHRQYIGTLPRDDIPKLAIAWLTSFLSLSVAAVGILLAVYLLLT